MKDTARSVAWEQILPRATLLLISLVATAPIWGPGLLNTRGGGDSPFLLFRTHQLAANLRAGAFPARWMPDAAYGFGYPFFSYYASLPYYAAAGLQLLGLDILTAIKLTQTLFMAAAALTMYQWAERVLRSRPAALLAAIAYATAPFHLVNVYVRGDSLSEFAAFAFYPLILWGIDRLASRPSLRRTLHPALAYAGLIVTHNVSALIFSPFLLLYVALHVGRMARLEPKRPLAQAIGRYALLAVPLVIALLLSAWFWLPALAETHDVQLTAQTSGYFFYGNHFRGTNLVQRHLWFSYATGREVTSPFAMGLAQALLAFGGALVVASNLIRTSLSARHEGPDSLAASRDGGGCRRLAEGFALFGLLLATWMITPLSRPLWDCLPLLPMVQFPWRFLSIQALFAAWLTGAALSRVMARGHRPAWATALALGGILTTTSLIGLQPDYLPITPDDVTVERLQLYELFSGNIGSTIRHEYLPRWVKPRPYLGPGQVSPDAPPRAVAIEGTLLAAEKQDHDPTRRVWHLETGSEGATVAFPLYYWPGWRGSVDGKRVDVEPAVGSGYLSLKVPPGSHAVRIRLGRTPLRLGAEITSSVTALSLIAAVVIAWARRTGKERHPDDDRTGEREASSFRGPSLAVTYLPFAAVLLLITTFHPRVTVTSDQDLTMDFERMPYPHHNPNGLGLNGWRLDSYSYESPGNALARRITAGQELRVTLNWTRDANDSLAELAPPSSDLQLVSPAAIRREDVPPVADAAIGLGAGPALFESAGNSVIPLFIPSGTPPGIYLPRIDGTPSVYLKPVWVESSQPAPEEPTHGTFADKALKLHDVRVAHPRPNRLDIQLDWSGARPVAANYGLSLRLTDPAGNQWLHQDGRPGYNTQPGHGFLPTSLWPLDRLIQDHHRPAVRSGAPPGDDYVLTIDLYEVATWRSVGQVTTTVALTEVSKRPDAPVAARFGEALLLSRLDVPSSARQGERVAATAYWSVAKRPSRDYVVEYRLDGPDDRIVGTQQLAPGSTPETWPPGAWIAGRMALSLPPTAPPGDYAVSLTLKDPTDGQPIGSYTHPVPLHVQKQQRIWELPAMGETVRVRFGDMIELAGYDLIQKANKVELTLYWQALTTPDRHYMFFVHLADPETGEPASQVDTMPHQFNYPTGQWAPGEVVSDVVEISTRDVSPGRYVLTVGWYDPDTNRRLPAFDSEGARLSDDRLVLPRSITLP